MIYINKFLSRVSFSLNGKHVLSHYECPGHDVHNGDVETPSFHVRLLYILKQYDQYYSIVNLKYYSNHFRIYFPLPVGLQSARVQL